MKLGVASSAGRFDRPLAWLARSVNRIEHQCVLSFHTEVTGRSPAGLIKTFKDPKWNFVHIFGPGASEECLTRYRKDVFELAGDPFTRQLSDKTWVRSPKYGGKQAAPVRALVAPLRLRKGSKRVIITINVHMPLDNTAPRAAAWIACCAGLVALVRELEKFYPGAAFIINADWNKNWKNAHERDLMVEHLLQPLGKEFRYSWSAAKHLPAGGTHGNDIIDGFITNLPVEAVMLLEDDKSSDHRPAKAVVNA